MAIAKFHSLRGEKSALIQVKANKFQMQWSPAYVPKEAVEGLVAGAEFSIPDNYRLVPIVDINTGEIRTSKDGHQLCSLEW